MATIAGADAHDKSDSQPLLSTHVEGDDVETMSERIPGHSKLPFGGATTSTAPRTSPPPSRRRVDVPNVASNPINNPTNADRKRRRIALVWSYAPDWFVLFCLLPLAPFGVHCLTCTRPASRPQRRW